MSDAQSLANGLIHTLTDFTEGYSEDRTWSPSHIGSHLRQLSAEKLDAVLKLRAEAELLSNTLIVNVVRGWPTVTSDVLASFFHTLRPAVESLPDLGARSDPESLPSNDNLAALDSTLRWFRLRLQHGASLSPSSWHGTILCLQALPKDPPSFLTVSHHKLPPRHQHPLELEDDEVNGEIVQSWISPFLEPSNGRLPAYYHRECLLMSELRERDPYFLQCAVAWPGWTEQFWSEVGPSVRSLFSTENFDNLCNWFMLWARVTCETSGILTHKDRERELQKVVVRLTQALRSRSITRLHIAAMLGLPSLCTELIDATKPMGLTSKCRGYLGDPLVCALAGPDVLAYFSHDTACHLPSMYDPLHVIGECQGSPHDKHLASNRSDTIMAILGCGLGRPYSDMYSLRCHRHPVAAWALWAAFSSGNIRILLDILSSTPILMDNALVEAVAALCELQNTAKGVLVKKLLLLLVDCTLVWTVQHGPSAEIVLMVQEKAPTAAADVAASELYDMTIRGIGDIRYEDLLTEAVAEESAFILERLTFDPRFNADFRPIGPGHNSRETLLHKAVGSDSHEIVAILLHAGADALARDEEGRTPIMCIESNSMLDLLIGAGIRIEGADHNGRTLWHYAAASNDTRLLSWLYRADPNKKENIKAVSYSGATPLALALLSIRENSHKNPLAALYLLPGLDQDSLQSPESLPHLAVAWGNLHLVQQLVALGADFKQLDKQGRSPLHHLNLSASEELIEMVKILCDGMPLAAADGTTPIESIFLNTQLEGEDSIDPRPTGHPSCHGSFDPVAFTCLIDSKLLAYRDEAGDGIWARFCKNVVTRYLVDSEVGHAPQLSFLPVAITQACGKLALGGALRNYEEDTGKHAIMALSQGKDDVGRTKWRTKDLSEIYAEILAHPSNPALSDFLISDEAFYLLENAVVFSSELLVQRLCRLGVPVNNRENEVGVTILELALTAALPGTDKLCRSLIIVMPPADLMNRQRQIFTALRIRPLTSRLMLLQVLWAKTIKSDPAPGTLTMLGFVVQAEMYEEARSLLKLSADPIFGGERGGLMAAASTGTTEILPDLLKVIGTDFPWRFTFKAHDVTMNVIKTAALKDHADFLQLLFDATQGWEEVINESFGDTTAAQIAGMLDSADTLKVLHEHGADLTVTYPDTPGYTMMHMATRYKKTEVLRFLQEVVPELENVADEEGLLPHQIKRVRSRSLSTDRTIDE